MGPLETVLAVSLGLLTLALAILAARAFDRYRERRVFPQLMWGGGLGLGAAAMGVETVVYVGYSSMPLLQAYVFLSAALVGVLSLGSTRVLRRPRLERAYSWFTAVACAVVGVASFLVPVPASMVTNGVISGDPPLVLLLLSILVTGPATVVLIGSAVVSIRRSWKWQTLMMIAGALVLGTGGLLYIATFPIFLYYAEFLGIGLLFLGLMSLPPSPATAPAGHGLASAH